MPVAVFAGGCEGTLLYFCAVPWAADPCLQSDVYARRDGADLVRQLSVMSSREIPLLTPGNGTLMALGQPLT